MKKYRERLEECKKESFEISSLCRDVVKKLKGSKCYTDKSEIAILVPYYDKIDRLNSEIYELKFDMTPNIGSIILLKENNRLGVIIDVSPLDHLDDYKDNQYLDIRYRILYFIDDSCKEYDKVWYYEYEFDTVIYDTLSMDNMILIGKLNRYK